ncbi:hypothetical protein B0O99DRAFT_595773 [Bisporella sp. PMI_857]|nr:hypothetical protein B0O99DRAFT_595773 [Bisporella sp. PMI_857]
MRLKRARQLEQLRGWGQVELTKNERKEDLTTDDETDDNILVLDIPPSFEATKYWSEFDQGLLFAISQREYSLWKRCTELTGKIPPDFLPDGIAVDGTYNLNFKFKGKVCTNKNWSDKFCGAFNKVICCPFLHRSPALFRYALQLAAYHRLKDKSPLPKPSDISVLSSGRCERLLSKFNLTNPRGRSIAEKYFSKIIGSDLPEHVGFLEYIEPVMRNERRNINNAGLGLMTSDMWTIAMAWDLYATEWPRNIELKTMDQYQKAILQKPAEKLDRKALQQKKKAWIIGIREGRSRNAVAGKVAGGYGSGVEDDCIVVSQENSR